MIFDIRRPLCARSKTDCGLDNDNSKRTANDELELNNSQGVNTTSFP